MMVMNKIGIFRDRAEIRHYDIYVDRKLGKCGFSEKRS